MNTNTNHIASSTTAQDKKPQVTTQAEIDAMKQVGSRNQSVTGLDSKSHDLAHG